MNKSQMKGTGRQVIKLERERSGRWRGMWLILLILITAGCRTVGSAEEITILPGTDTASFSQPLNKESSTAGDGNAPPVTSPVRATWIICEIKGHVAKPGVYDLGEGSRVSELIKRGGGALPTASLEWVNQARKLQDGEVLVIPAKGTNREDYEAMCIETPPLSPVQISGTGSDPVAVLVNINTATQSELESIPGIGPVTAQNIINYRTENGPFAVPEDLKNVDRIGEKTFEKLKKFITVMP